MPVLFESSYSMTKEFYQEIFSFYSLKRPSKIIQLIVIILVLILMLWLAILDSFKSPLFYSALAIWLLLLAMHFLTYRLQVNMILKRNAELSKNTPISCTVSATQNSLGYRTSIGTNVEIDFSAVKSAFQTKNYIVLVSANKLTYSFCKNHFTVGNYEDFLQFLRSKGYKI